MSGRQERKSSEYVENEALRLHESGLEVDLLAERFGVTKGAIRRWITNAKQLRAAAHAK